MREEHSLSVIGNPCSEILRDKTDFLLARTSYNRVTWISPFTTPQELKEIVDRANELDINQQEDYHNVMKEV